MAECSVCGKENELQYTCNHCGRTFCSEHRLPESHSCPALLADKANKSWFDKKFEDVDADKTTKENKNVSRSDHIHDSRPNAKQSGNYTVADANPEKYANKDDHDNGDSINNEQQAQEQGRLDPNKNYSVADANSDESDEDNGQGRSHTSSTAPGGRESDDYETVDPDTNYRRRDVEPEYEHESPGLNPDGSLQSSVDVTVDATEEGDEQTGVPPFARLIFVLLILGVIGVSVYFLLL